MRNLRKSNLAAAAATVFLFAALVVSILLAVTFGTVSIPVAEVYDVIITQAFGHGKRPGRVSDVVWLIRLPRLILAVGVGASLAVSGLVMQAIVKNPIAEPYILGVSSGAYAGATIAILIGAGARFGTHSTGILAFIGAFLASLAVVAVANVGERANSVKLILTGTAVNAICGAFSNFVVYMSNDKNGIQQLVNWTMGSMAGADWKGNTLLIIAVSVSTLFFWSQHRTLNLMLLGDDAAVALGADPHRRRLVYLLVCAVLVGLSVNEAGMVGFVGLVVPHVIRLVFGANHKKLIPLCALSGGILLVWADVLCRIVVTGNELPIGILTSMLGAPCFIYLISRRHYRFNTEI